MTAWLELDKSTLDKNNQQPIPLFNNNQILYKNKPLLIKKWLDKDLKYMHQMCVNGRIKTYMEIKTEIGTYGALILDYLAIRNAIVNSKTPHDLTEIPELNPYKSTFVHLSNRTIRNMISKRIERLNCIAVWLRKINVDVSKHYSTAVHATKESKLRLLHYKIIHNIYPCNALLYKMKIKQSSKCDDCPELEFLDHMFVDCITLKPFWKHIEHKLAIIVGRTITISTAQALFGLTKSTDINVSLKKINEANHMLLLAKLCIVKHRYVKPSNIILMFEYELILREKQFPSLKHQEQ